jgi:hypothetical protein
MKRTPAYMLVALVLLFGGASEGRAQARRVKMKIDGYLCGN